MKRFQIWTRTSNEGEWSLYGEFRSEFEYKNELANIQALGLYVKRISPSR